jgi:proteasome accessory factor PafA2
VVVPIAKICGVETEYGVIGRGSSDLHPMAASSLLINSYVADVARRRVGWDYVTEQPNKDARGFYVGEVVPPDEVESHLVNAVLTNGGRFYVDHAHPEYSTPECTNPLDVVLYDRAGELILRRAMVACRRALGSSQEILVYKNNSDGKGNSYGCHENYLIDRAVPFPSLVSPVTAHFVTRQIFTGAGKIGCEASGASEGCGPFQLTQRADFFEEEVGLETTLKRPIINTRDEPHADPARYRRLHVIVGDANMSEVATFLKVGVTAIVLAMVEDGWLEGADIALAHPVKAMREVSYDLSLARPLELSSGNRATALEIQWELYGRALKLADESGLEFLGPSEIGAQVMREWESVLAGLESDPEGQADTVDWVAKWRLIRAYADKHQLPLDDARLAAIDLQYHDLRPERCLSARVGLRTLVDTEAAERAVLVPPSDTRAYFRGRCLDKWPSAIVAANWDSLVFDLGGESLRRVPMLEPSKGTLEHVGQLLDACDEASEMLDRLSGKEGADGGA